VTAICEDDEEVVDVEVHPLNIVKPTPLIRTRSRICRRRRFLKPRRAKATAIMLPGITGLGPWWAAAVDAGTLTVSVVVEVPCANSETEVGAKVQVAPIGKNPAQANEMDPLKEASAVNVSFAVPDPPAGTVIVESALVMVKDVAGRLMMYAAEATALML
jgi:hypothetical protein